MCEKRITHWTCTIRNIILIIVFSIFAYIVVACLHFLDVLKKIFAVDPKFSKEDFYALVKYLYFDIC